MPIPTRLPKVTIVIPCYNSEAYIEETITCALEHDYENIEVVVVDDGSTDGSQQIIEDFADRIRSVRTENRGICAARNLGIEMATGEYLQFLDSDDLLLPGKLQHEVELLENTGADALIGNFLRLMGDQRVEPLNYHSRERFESDEEFVMYTLPLVGRCLYRVSAAREVGGFPTFRRSEDFVFHFMLIAKGTKWIYSPEKFFLYRVYNDATRLSSLASVGKAPDEPKERILFVEQYLKEHQKFDDTARRALSYDCYRQAVSFYRLKMRKYGDAYLEMAKGYWDPPVVIGRRLYEFFHRTLGPRRAGRFMAGPVYRLLRKVFK